MSSRTKQEGASGYRSISSMGISSREAADRFERLQEKLLFSLAHCFDEGQASFVDEPQTIVVIPSLSTVDSGVGVMTQAYEERFLFLLLLLRYPRVRLIYVTSQPVQPSVIEYYLGLMPGIIPTQARQRLFMLAPCDSSDRPLSEKILERPPFIERIRSLILDPDRAHLVPFNTTILERDVALHLGIPMYGADPRFFSMGFKSGAREIFAEEGIPHPAGFENIISMEQLVSAICKLRAMKPRLPKALVKLNEGVSGEGNASIDLTDLPEPGNFEEVAAVEARVRKMRFASQKIGFKTYMTVLQKRGAVVEEFLEAMEIRSPSVQLRVNPVREVQILSTHDQLLGGPTGQSYLGAKFPADPTYARLITQEALKVGKRLAKEGVMGRFALDFVVARTGDGSWDPYAIELNLRKGGTTHPFLTLKFLTDGAYDFETAEFLAPNGARKYFVATDHAKSPLFRNLTPDTLFDLSVRRHLHFDHSRQTGVVFHMMTALPEHGKVGFTAVANSPEEAYALYEHTLQVLAEEGEAASRWKPLPEF